MCRDKYFVSERDMLLATRRAIFDEVVTFKQSIAGDEFDAMRAFLKVLHKYYPSAPDVRASARRLLIPITDDVRPTTVTRGLQ